MELRPSRRRCDPPSPWTSDHNFLSTIILCRFLVGVTYARLTKLFLSARRQGLQHRQYYYNMGAKLWLVDQIWIKLFLACEVMQHTHGEYSKSQNALFKILAPPCV